AATRCRSRVAAKPLARPGGPDGDGAAARLAAALAASSAATSPVARPGPERRTLTRRILAAGPDAVNANRQPAAAAGGGTSGSATNISSKSIWVSPMSLVACRPLRGARNGSCPGRKAVLSRTSPTRRRLGGAALAAALLGGTAFAAVSAQAEPASIAAKRAELGQIQSEVAAIDNQLELAAEAYNGARYNLIRINGRIEENRRGLQGASNPPRAPRPQPPPPRPRHQPPPPGALDGRGHPVEPEHLPGARRHPRPRPRARGGRQPRHRAPHLQGGGRRDEEAAPRRPAAGEGGGRPAGARGGRRRGAPRPAPRRHAERAGRPRAHARRRAGTSGTAAPARPPP